MTKKEYVLFHLVCILNLQNNEEIKALLKEGIEEFSDEQIDSFYCAVTGMFSDIKKNSLVLKELYDSVYGDDVKRLLTPSQTACLWQGNFEYGRLSSGYIERDKYKDETFSVGQYIYALVPNEDCETPQYFFDEKVLIDIVNGTALDAYALLQLDPYWSGGYGARTVINKYEVIQEFVGAKGYAYENHHLSRETYAYEPLSCEDKIKMGIGKYHVECEPYDEDHIEYEYILPPAVQIFIPENCKGFIKLSKKNVFQLKDDMREYKELYKSSILSAQEKRIRHLRLIYEQNKRFNNLP